MSEDKLTWEPMKLTHVGDVGEIITNTGGQGKTGVAADPGDPLKPPGQG